MQRNLKIVMNIFEYEIYFYQLILAQAKVLVLELVSDFLNEMRT